MKKPVILIKFYGVGIGKPFRYANQWWKKASFCAGLSLNRKATDRCMLSQTTPVAILKEDLSQGMEFYVIEEKNRISN